MQDRVFLQIIPIGFADKWKTFFYGIAQIFMRYLPQYEKSFVHFQTKYTPVEFLSIGMVSYAFLGIITTSLLLLSLSQNSDLAMFRIVLVSVLVGAMIFFLLTYMCARYPQTLATEQAKDVDKSLLYALRDIALQVHSGETVYKALSSVSTAGYGEASHQMEFLVREMNVGVPLEKTVKKQILQTRSEYLRKADWQILNSLRAGSDLRRGLESIINELDRKQKNEIESYARELNLWSLVYMLFSVAIPTIGLTMLVILSTFAGFGVGPSQFVFFIIICFIIQTVLIVFVKSRRPVVQF